MFPTNILLWLPEQVKTLSENCFKLRAEISFYLDLMINVFFL